ncbi:MAG TPA: hypothetical protein VGJ26_14800 [Pirellulales bacterium]|jgi:hypothetical protein
MSRQSLSILLILYGLLAQPLRAEDPVAPPAAAASASEGLLLLRNGQVMRGKITPAGDYYFVTLTTGEIRLRKDQVDLLAADLEACYQHKRVSIDPSKLNERQDLAQWCILQDLYDNAERELAEAAKLDGKNARTALIERQLKLARERAPRNAPAQTQREHIPSNEDLDRLVRGMPPGSVETFSSTIQPLLLNTCATSGCHGPQTNCELKLVRVQIGKGANRRLTQRNLHSVLQMIDRADPPGSRLLTAPIGPHGETGAPIFTSKQAVQYRQLVNWVSRVAQSPESELPASVTRPDDKLLQRVAIRQWSEAPGAAPSTALSPNGAKGIGAKEATATPAPGASAAGNPTPGEIPGSRRASAPRPIDQATPAPSKPTKLRANKPLAAPAVDPFDPEAFNRRYLP